MTPEERTDFLKRVAAKERARVEAMSPERRAAHRKAKAEEKRARIAAMSDEQRAAYRKEMVDKERARRAAMSPEARKTRNRNEMSPAQRAKRNKMKAIYRAKSRAVALLAKQENDAAKEAARKVLIPIRRKENRAAFNKDASGIYRRIRLAIPSSYPADVRDDVSSDIAIALFDGEIAISEIEASAQRFISQHYTAREWHQVVSFDTLIGGTDGLTIGDTIAA